MKRFTLEVKQYYNDFFTENRVWNDFRSKDEMKYHDLYKIKYDFLMMKWNRMLSTKYSKYTYREKK